MALLVLRQADFGIKTSHGLICIAGIFAILMMGPRLANILPPVGAFFINAVCIFTLMMLGCHNVIMHNHSTFVLGYLLLYGYDVTGNAYVMRLTGLAVGMVICMAIFYKNQRKRPYRRNFLDLFREFDINSARNRWQTAFNTFGALSIASSIFGMPMAVALRIGINAISSLYTICINKCVELLHLKRVEKICEAN